MIEVISTRQHAPGERLEFWNELIGSTYDGMVVDTAPGAFNACLGVWQLAELRMARPQSRPATITRHERNRSASVDRTYVAHMLTKGQVELEQRGRRSALTAGDMVICAAEEFYRFNAITNHEMMVIEFDGSALSNRLPTIDDHVARTISGKLPGTRIVRRYMNSLWQEARAFLPPAQGRLHADILMELTVACLQQQGVEPSIAPDPLLVRMDEIIAERLDEFDFGPAVLAQALGLPLRTVQSCAARAGSTVGQMITTARLRRAARMLAAEPDATISRIAFDCGFADPSYFTRRFQSAHGVSPSQFRQRN